MLSLAIKMCVCVNKIWIDLEKARNNDKNDQTNMKTFLFLFKLPNTSLQLWLSIFIEMKTTIT